MKIQTLLKRKKLWTAIIIIIAIALVYTQAGLILCMITSVVSPNHPCYCPVNSEKNRVAVIVSEGGIYDTDAVSSAVSGYYASVKKDLNIDNAGLKKFPGKKVDELDKFVDDLYTNDNVAYIILIGDDLPTADVNATDMTNLHAIYWKFECVNEDCGCCGCSDVALSSIMPPFFQPDEEKVSFIIRSLETYADYHNNFKDYMKKYPRVVLHLTDYMGSENGEYIGLDDPKRRLGYDMPKEYVYNTEYQKVADELKDEHLVLYFSIHGDPTTGRDMSLSIIGKQQLERVGGSAFLSAKHTNPYWTTADEYLEFARENGAPALFVEASSCGDIIIKSPQNSTEYCCWPQVFMDTGAWAYYSSGGADYEGKRMKKAFSNEQTIGLAVRKYMVQQDFIFGDILAHMK